MEVDEEEYLVHPSPVGGKQRKRGRIWFGMGPWLSCQSHASSTWLVPLSLDNGQPIFSACAFKPVLRRRLSYDWTVGF